MCSKMPSRVPWKIIASNRTNTIKIFSCVTFVWPRVVSDMIQAFSQSVENKIFDFLGFYLK